MSQVEKIINDEKKALLATHYDLSETVGHHGEFLVAEVCKHFGYTEVEVRQEKHGNLPLGLLKRDIDVFAKHPSGEYYQNIEVKNRRDFVTTDELTHNTDNQHSLPAMEPASWARFGGNMRLQEDP